MAHTLETWPTEATRGARYPWDEWANGQVWHITKGTDFTCGIETMVHNIHRTAKRLNLGIRTHLKRNQGVIVFQFLHPGAP